MKVKKILSILLLCSMILTTNGFYTLAESIDDIVEQTVIENEKIEETENEDTVEQFEEGLEEQSENPQEEIEEPEEIPETLENISEEIQEEPIESQENQNILEEQDIEEPDIDKTEEIQTDYPEELEEDIVEEIEEESNDLEENIASDSELNYEEDIDENYFSEESETLEEPEEDIIASESEIEEDEAEDNIEEPEEIPILFTSLQNPGPIEESIASESEIEENDVLEEISTSSELEEIVEEIEEATPVEIEKPLMLMQQPLMLFGATPLSSPSDTWKTGVNWADAYMYRKEADKANKLYISNTEYTGDDLFDIYRYNYDSASINHNNFKWAWKTKNDNTCRIDTPESSGNYPFNFNTGEIIILDDIQLSSYDSMFANSNTSRFKKIEGLEHIKTSDATSLAYMFAGYDGTTELDLSHFDTSNVTSVESMFDGAVNMPSVNIENWDMSSITNYDKWFKGCTHLTSIFINPESYNPNDSATYVKTFESCFVLRGMKNTSIPAEDQFKTYNRIDLPGQPGLLTTKIKYPVGFSHKFWEGTEPAEIPIQQVLWGNTAIKPSNPTDENNVFKGWYADEACTIEFDWTTQIKDETTIYVKWNPKYDIHFRINGHGVAPSSQRTEKGLTVTNPGNLTETGWTFHGWFKDDGSLTQPWNFSVATISENPTNIYAKWTENNYTVTYNTNGGTWTTPGRTDVSTRSYTSALTLDTGITKTGYTFGGWFENSAFAAESVRTEIPINTAQNKTVYAKWVENTYDIIFNVEGGIWNPEYTIPTSRYYTQAVTLPNANNITKAGYNLEGWHKQSDFSDPAITQTDHHTEEVYILYAKWVITEYSLVINANGGEWVSSYTFPTSQNRNINTATIVLPTSTDMIRTGYEFGGWYENNSYTGTKYEQISQGTDLRNITLYAKWTPQVYNITYHLEVATASELPSVGNATIRSGNVANYTYGNQLTLTTDVVFNGYKFLGWYKENTFTNPISVITTTTLGDIDLYGKWEQVPTYTLSFNANGGSGSQGSITMTHGVQTIIPGCSFSRYRYSFAGWKDSNGTSYSAGQRYIINQNKTLIAQWNYVGGGSSSGGSGGGGGGGGGGVASAKGQTPGGLSPLNAETPEQLQQKYNNSPVAPGTFMIIHANGKGSKNLTDLENSNSNYRWYQDEATGQYYMYSKDTQNNFDFVSGWAFIEYLGQHRYYFFDPKTSTMKTGFYTDPTTKKTYCFHYDKNSVDYGMMLTNTSITVGNSVFTFNEKGEMIN